MVDLHLAFALADWWKVALLVALVSFLQGFFGADGASARDHTRSDD